MKANMEIKHLMIGQKCYFIDMMNISHFQEKFYYDNKIIVKMKYIKIRILNGKIVIYLIKLVI